MQKTKVSPTPLLVSKKTPLFYSDTCSFQATSWHAHSDSRPAPPAAALLPDPHVSTGGARDRGRDPLGPLLQLCPLGQSPRRSGGGQLSVWQVPRASGPRDAPHCQYPHAGWQAFPEGMQNGGLSSRSSGGLRRGFRGSNSQGDGDAAVVMKARPCAWKNSSKQQENKINRLFYSYCISSNI